MNRVKRMNRRGLSVMIGYILLVSIGLALSAMVYSWILFYLPSGEVVECPEGLSLSIKNVDCNSSTKILNFSIKNIGLHSIDGISIKVDDKTYPNMGVFLVAENFTKILPGEELSYSYSYYDLVIYDKLMSELTLLELQPQVKVDGESLYCQPTVKEFISCS